MVERSKLDGTDFDFYALEELTRSGGGEASQLPMTIKIMPSRSTIHNTAALSAPSAIRMPISLCR